MNETNLQTACFYLKHSFFKNKKRSGTSLQVSFSARFLKKNISPVIFYYLTKFHGLFVFISCEILCIVFAC